MKIFRRLRRAWAALNGKMLLSKQPVFEPKFYTTNLELEGETGTYNYEYFATEDSAQELMRRFGALAITLRPKVDGEKYTPPMWELRFEDGAMVNAGQLCKFFKDQPQEIATVLCLQYIQMLRQDKQAG